jgi:hypothetical protein
MAEQKQCSKCEIVKPITDFYIRRLRKNSVCAVCIECKKKIAAELYLKNKEHIRKRNEKWKKENREKNKNMNANYKRKNKNIISIKGKEHYQLNKEKISKNHSEYFKNNREALILKINREALILKINQWKENNPEKVRLMRLRSYEKTMSTIDGRINNAIGPEIWRAIKNSKSGRRWESLVGYTIDQLKEHLERQFSPEMSWDNYASYWEIDHRIPKSSFKYTSYEDEEFKKCWGLNNLQPLQKGINRRKSNKLFFNYG